MGMCPRAYRGKGGSEGRRETDNRTANNGRSNKEKQPGTLGVTAGPSKNRRDNDAAPALTIGEAGEETPQNEAKNEVPPLSGDAPTTHQCDRH